MVMLSRFSEKDTANSAGRQCPEIGGQEFSELTGKALNGAGREAMPDYLTGEGPWLFRTAALGSGRVSRRRQN